jgi:CheY-like chemotaxis protein
MQGYWQAALHRPDVIVTDLRMPLGGGNYLLECLRRNPETVDIPVLVLSGLSARSLSGRVELLGAAALLQKPICSEELIENIAKFIPLREREGIKPTQVRRP